MAPEKLLEVVPPVSVRTAIGDLLAIKILFLYYIVPLWEVAHNAENQGFSLVL